MKRKAFVFFVCAAAVFGLFHCGGGGSAAAQESNNSFMDMVFSAIENSVKLDLSDENLKIIMSGDPVSKEDAKFMGLLRAKLRLAHIFKQLERPEEDFSVRNGYEIARIFMVVSSSGSLNATDAPFDLGDYIVYQIISPLGLEPLIRELPAYYQAVKSREDWQEKFDLIFETGDTYGPSLNNGKTFYLAGFPKVNTEEAYVSALDVSTNDEVLYLGEFDSSIEGWLYSFWLRRYKDGSMETVKMIIDWLNTQLDAAAKAVG